MTISKILIAGGQMYLRRSYATGSKLVETIQDNDTGDNIAISINVFLIYGQFSLILFYSTYQGLILYL